MTILIPVKDAQFYVSLDNGTYPTINAAIEAVIKAVNAERERCAKIAEEYTCTDGNCICSEEHGFLIASRIRSGE